MAKPAKEDLQSLWNRLGLTATVVSRFGAITRTFEWRFESSRPSSMKGDS
jgi:hypothetical protein